MRMSSSTKGGLGNIPQKRGPRAKKPLCLVVLAMSIPSLACRSSAPSRPASRSPQASAAWTLLWSDEFEGPTGSPVDATKWVLQVGGNGWGNSELQYYTERTANAFLSNGSLAIRALREPYLGPDGVARDFTSARLKTQGHFEQAYGRFEARLKIPRGQGVWPAFWLLGADIPQVGWPRCGEIDIMENIGREPSTVHGTIHGPGYSAEGGLSAAYMLPGAKVFADDFHVFAVEWEPSEIRWYVDDRLFAKRTPSDLPPGRSWVFDHPFFVILNLAVGGKWPGNPDSTTIFPQTLLVDYVRVFRKS